MLKYVKEIETGMDELTVIKLVRSIDDEIYKADTVPAQGNRFYKIQLVITEVEE